MMQQQNQPIGFRFINTVHPSDATSFSSLSQIRSHAAKDTRARTQRSRQAASLPDNKPSKRMRRRNGVEKAMADRREDNTEPICSREQSSAEKTMPSNSQSTVPSVPQISRFCRRDPHWSPARQLSAMEGFLLDHYIGYLIIFRDGSCNVPSKTTSCRNVTGNSKVWFTNMQLKCWLPFALADLGLLTALLLQSCRSLGIMNMFQNYKDMYIAYKQQCIRSTNDSLSFEDTRVSDATIAMVMILVAESYTLSNIEEWKVHLRAFTKMITMRGGLSALGLDGFLKEVIVKSPQVYGRWNL